ncbi:unnamed protein product [Schistocephalus solidus]|uniref:MFS domain-containing protein n=1 Tax=Schistocephalus solidus TaxID=70667 RepID=A0A183SHZ8_SCHSO|nr:unnamed protein product [Schistocephalus solidus]
MEDSARGGRDRGREGNNMQKREWNRSDDGSSSVSRTVWRRKNVDELLTEVITPFGWWQFIVTMLAVWSDIPAAIFPVYGNSVPRFRCAADPSVETLLLRNSSSFNVPTHVFSPKGPATMIGNKYAYDFDTIAAAMGPWSWNRNESDLEATDEEIYGCYRYKRDWSKISNASQLIAMPSLPSATELETCQSGYVYEVDEFQYPSGIVIEWDLVCDKEWLAPLSTSVYMLGMVPGFWIGGWCADALGRRPTALGFLVAQIISGLLCTLAPHFAVYATFRFFLGLTTVARSNVLLILPVELTLARYRFIVTLSTCIVQSFLNRAMTALVAYFIPYWRWLHLATLAPLLVGILQVYYLPESPRWLLGQEKTKEAALVLFKGYLLNRRGLKCWRKPQDRPLTLEDFEKFFEDPCQKDEKQSADSVYDLSEPSIDSQNPKTTTHFRSLIRPRTIWNGLRKPYSSRRLARVSLIATFLFAGQTACLYGVLLYARIIRSYVYLVALINNLTGIPGAILSSILYARIRHRKRPLMTVYACASLSLAIGGLYAWLFPLSNDIVLTVCSNLGLVLSTAITNMLLTYIPELYPSCIRSQGLGNAAGLGRIGAAFGTFINQLDATVAHGVPLVFYAGLLLLALVALIFMPDTTGENLPDKMEAKELEGDTTD